MHRFPSTEATQAAGIEGFVGDCPRGHHRRYTYPADDNWEQQPFQERKIACTVCDASRLGAELENMRQQFSALEQDWMKAEKETVTARADAIRECVEKVSQIIDKQGAEWRAAGKTSIALFELDSLRGRATSAALESLTKEEGNDGPTQTKV